MNQPLTKKKTTPPLLHKALFCCCFFSLLLSFGEQAIAQDSNNQDPRVSISRTNVSIKSLLTEIEQQTGFVFFYNNQLVDVQKTASVQVENKKLSETLAQLFEKSNIAYKIMGKQIALYPKGSDSETISEIITQSQVQATTQERNTPEAQRISSVTAGTQTSRTVRGTVTDETGPLPGAAVAVKGNPKKNITTNIDGKFELSNIDPNAVLIISFLGYETVEYPINGRALVDILMKINSVQLEEVVVTGMFNRPRESYSGAVASVSAKDIDNFRGQNLISTLKNIDPSINIVTNNMAGSNPNALPDITIRGNSSLPMNVQEFNEGVKQNLNTPLIIMDGFEISLSKLMDYNDEEILSINILKDASATAIYGSRGANGVIVVITKQPEKGKLRINARADLSLEIPDLTSYSLLNAQQKLDLEYTNGFYNNTNTTTDLRLKKQYADRLRDVLSGVDTYWLSQPLQIGLSQKYNLRMEGGSDEFRWGISSAYNHNAGVMKGSYRDNFSTSISLAYSYKNVMIKNQTNIGVNKGVESKYGSFSEYVKMNAYWKPYDEDGNLVKTFYGLGATTPTIGNPLYNATLNTINESKYTELINNLSIDWAIASGLNLRGQLGISKRINSSDLFYPPTHTMFMVEPYISGDGYFRRGQYTYGTGEDFNYDGNITLSYTKTFADKHQLYVGINYSISQRDSYVYTFIVEGFPNEKLYTPGGALRYQQDGKPNSYQNLIRTIGLTSNVNYTYDNRYYIDLSLRADGSSQFGNNNRFAPFWSAGIGWNIHREHFFNITDIINTLRMRLSYGQTGSQQFSAYQALSTYAYYTADKYVNWTGAYLKGHGNEDLKWQVTDQANLGLELALFNNRINASVDVYQKKTSNLLSNMEVPYATGFGYYIDNIGEVKNTGVEASLGGYILRNPRGFTWMTTVKFAYNKNTITKLSDAVKAQTEQYKKEDVDVSTLFYEGYPQNSIYAVRSLGIDPSTGQEVFLSADGVVVDTWNPSDKIYLGSGEPLYRGNISTLFSYKNLSLNASFGYYWGGVIYNQTLVNRVEVLRSEIANQNLDSRVLTDRWSQPGDHVHFKKIATATEASAGLDIQTRATSRFVMDDRSFEMQSATLQYDLKTDWLKKVGIQNMKLGINMSDIFYISTVKRERGTTYPFSRRVGGSITLMF